MAKEERLITPVGRVSWPTLVEPRAPEPGKDPKYSVTLIFDAAAQKDPSFAALKDAVRRAAVGRFGEAAVTALAKAGKWKSAIHKGEEKLDSDGQPMVGYEPGTVWIAASSKFQPSCVDGAMQKVGADAIYAGCYARASLVVFAYEHPTGGKGVTFGLRNLQFVADGEKFGSKSSATDEFAPVPGFVAKAREGSEFATAPAAAPARAAAPAKGAAVAAVAPIADEEIPF